MHPDPPRGPAGDHGRTRPIGLLSRVLYREACGTADQLDTAILHQQHTGCQCQNALRWATEITDLGPP